MDEPTEVWEQPPAPPVAVPAITEHSDAQHFMHRQAKDAGKPCPCDWCEEHGYEIADLTDEIWALKRQTAEIEVLRHQMEAWKDYAAKLKNQTAEPVRVIMPPMTSQSNGKYTKTQFGGAVLWDLFEAERKQDLAEIRQMNRDLKTVDKGWRDVRRARLYAWGEMLWMPLFIVLVILSYIFP